MNAYIGNILQNRDQLRDNFDYNKPKRASERKLEKGKIKGKGKKYKGSKKNKKNKKKRRK